MKPKNRPNVTPAKHIPNEERMAENPEMRKNRRERRMLIGELCDFCLKDIRIKRSFMGLKLRGWRHSCIDCVQKNEFKLKRDKIILEFLPSKKHYE